MSELHRVDTGRLLSLSLIHWSLTARLASGGGTFGGLTEVRRGWACDPPQDKSPNGWGEGVYEGLDVCE